MKKVTFQHIFITIPADLIRQSKRGSPFSETDAIMDILTMADENGEFYSTTRKLMNRWEWGAGRAVSFLKNLEERNIIRTQTEHKRNTLYIVNKEFFVCLRNANGTQTEHRRNANEAIEKPNQDAKNSEKVNKKEDNLQLLERLLPNYPISEILSDKVREWISYKISKRETYVEPGMKSLLKIISQNARKNGDFAVMDLIDMCMSNNWKGIIWDKLELKRQNNQKNSINATKQSQLEYLLNSIREDEMNEQN